MAQSGTLDVFAENFCSYLPNYLVFGITLTLPAAKRVDIAIDYKTHHYANHRAFLILFGLFIPVDIVDSLLKGVPHFLALGPIYFVSGLLFFVGLATAAITRNERYHQFYAVFFLAQTIVISFLIFQILG